MNTAESETNQTASLTNNEDDSVECRACLQKFDSETSLFNLFQPWTPPWDRIQGSIAEDLASLANIQLTESDPHSNFICETCCEKLQNACNFTSLVRENDYILRQRYPHLETEAIDKVWPKPIQLDKNINGAVYENVADVEIKQEVPWEDEYANGGEGYREMEMAPLDIIKIEPEEIVEQSPMQITVNGAFSLAQHNGDSTPILNGCSDIYEEEEHLDPVKLEPPSDEESQDSIPDLSLECLLCMKVFHSVSGLKAHVIAQHSYKTVKRKTDNNPSPEKKQKNDKYVCATCRRTFTTSTDLMVHETCHNKDVCYGCNEKFDSFAQLIKHRRRCKAILNAQVTKPKTLKDVTRNHEEQKQPEPPTTEQLSCPTCNEQFTDAYYMTIHQEIHHSANPETTETADNEPMETEALESIFSEN